MTTTPENKPSEPSLSKIQKTLSEKSIFGKFEYLVILFVTFILSLIILVALIRLTENVYSLILMQLNDTTDFKSFQITFGMLLTLLIAFEFKNSINAILSGKGLIVQVRIVILIAIIALARKFLVLDPKEYAAETMMAYALIALSLGLTYWLLNKR